MARQKREIQNHDEILNLYVNEKFSIKVLSAQFLISQDTLKQFLSEKNVLRTRKEAYAIGALKLTRNFAEKNCLDCKQNFYGHCNRAFCDNCLKERHLTRRLKNVYNLSIDQYEILLKNQNNSCAICKKKFDLECSHIEKHIINKRRTDFCRSCNKPNVDHCHETGRVRGILCRHCNHILGAMGDSLEGILKIIEYLKPIA